jgi:triphosphoribosyl-dephospho-CoA synthase
MDALLSRESHIPTPAPSRDPLPAALARLPAAIPPRGRGWCAAVACIFEASAPKPGNVHPDAAFDDLTYDDLVAAAVAVAPAMEAARSRPLGRTILDAVGASRQVTVSNANLGIVLAIAPLAAATAAVGAPPDSAAVTAVLARLDRLDSADVWQAIGLARPGGMATSGKWDVHGPPPDDLLAAMRLAAHRDQIARLWATGYVDLFAGPIRDLSQEIDAGRPLADAIVLTHLRQLARHPDTLIARRHGEPTAADVSRRAAAVLAAGDAWRAAAADFDRFLRSPRRINPGTTADLVAAALYILLVDGRIAVAAT